LALALCHNSLFIVWHQQMAVGAAVQRRYSTAAAAMAAAFYVAFSVHAAAAAAANAANATAAAADGAPHAANKPSQTSSGNSINCSVDSSSSSSSSSSSCSSCYNTGVGSRSFDGGEEVAFKPLKRRMSSMHRRTPSSNSSVHGHGTHVTAAALDETIATGADAVASPGSDGVVLDSSVVNGRSVGGDSSVASSDIGVVSGSNGSNGSSNRGVFSNGSDLNGSSSGVEGVDAVEALRAFTGRWRKDLVRCSFSIEPASGQARFLCYF
jgi:hypothetical protein